jgi:hypothetical protein
MMSGTHDPNGISHASHSFANSISLSVERSSLSQQAHSSGSHSLEALHQFILMNSEELVESNRTPDIAKISGGRVPASTEVLIFLFA